MLCTVHISFSIPENNIVSCIFMKGGGSRECTVVGESGTRGNVKCTFFIFFRFSFRVGWESFYLHVLIP